MLTLLTREAIDELMYLYADRLAAALGGNLISVVLFGSCARGDHSIGSDVNVFILVNDDSLKVKYLINRLSDKIDWQYGTSISNVIRSLDYFNRYKSELLYGNIKREGIVYY
jgi:predicted nucleotidyltransferase